MAETERVARKTYRMRKQARSHVFDYIEQFYNAKRHRAIIGYPNPITFDERVMKT